MQATVLCRVCQPGDVIKVMSSGADGATDGRPPGRTALGVRVGPRMSTGSCDGRTAHGPTDRTAASDDVLSAPGAV